MPRIGAFMFKTDNQVLSSLGSVFTHGLAITPKDTIGVVRVFPRTATPSIGFCSLSDSQTVTIQAVGNGVQADVEVQIYHSIIV